MPDQYLNVKPNGMKRSHKASLLIFLIIILLLALVSSTSALVYFIENPASISFPQLNNTTAAKIDNSKYSKLDDYKCRNESEYNNDLILNTDIAAYPRNEFYLAKLDKKDTVVTVSKAETLYIELLMWENDDQDSLVYTGRALVCIKGYDKLATIEFDTNNASLKYPVRYKDPEKRISNILIQAFYMVPSDAVAKSDWMTKIQNNLKNIQLAQQRIFDGKSNIDFKIYPEILNNNDLQRNFLTQIARGIVTKDKNNSLALQPVDYLDNNIYSVANLAKHSDFDPKNADLKKYDQISSVIYFEVGDSSGRTAVSRGNESGYAFINSALENGNYFGIIGTNLGRDISTESAAYHEFMHTLGLPDEYAYKDGSLQRTPTHTFMGQKENGATLMEDPSVLTLNKTYIDDQERFLMGVKP